MDFTFSTRCGPCTNSPTFDIAYGSDLCSSPTPVKYLNAGCTQKTISFNNYSLIPNNCPAGYTQNCAKPIYTTLSDGLEEFDGYSILCCPISGSSGNSQNYFTINCSNGNCSIAIAYQDRQLNCTAVESITDCLNSPDSTYTGGIQTDFPIPWVITPEEIYTVLKNITSPCAGANDFNCLPYSEVYSTNDSTKTTATCLNGQTNDNILPVFSCDNISAFGNACQTLTWIYDTQGAYNGNTNPWFNYNTQGGALQYNPGLGCPPGQIRMSECDTTTSIPANFGQGPAVESNPVNSIVCCDENIPKDRCTFLASFGGSSPPDDFCQLVCPSLDDQKYIGLNSTCDYSYYLLCKQTGCPMDPECETEWLNVVSHVGSGSSLPNSLPTVLDTNGYQTRSPTQPTQT